MKFGQDGFFTGPEGKVYIDTQNLIMHRRLVLAIVAASLISAPDARKSLSAAHEKPDGGAQQGLAREVRTKGWIVFSATSAQGDWDLYLMRPDGSARKNITNTADFHEAAALELPKWTTTRMELLISSLLVQTAAIL
jgi:hypothetical protein